MRWRPWMAELDGDKLNQLVGKMLADLGGAYSVPPVRIGHRLGLFGSLHDAGPATADELAGRMGLAPRYVREWALEQAATGHVTIDRETGRFRFSPEHNRKRDMDGKVGAVRGDLGGRGVINHKN